MAPGGGHAGPTENLVKGGIVQQKIDLMLDTAPFYKILGGPCKWPPPGAVLQARPPPKAVSNHAVDGGFEPEPSAPEASQHSAIPPVAGIAESSGAEGLGSKPPSTSWLEMAQ